MPARGFRECMIDPGKLTRLESSVDAMGTTFSVVLCGNHRDKMEEAATAAFDELQRLNNLLSIYLPASAWSEINRLAGQKPVTVSPEVFKLISRCLQYSRRSQGAFDITVGPLMKAWGFYKGAGRLPGQDEIAAAMSKVGHRHLCLDQARCAVRFDMEGVEINPGGIGKGYAVDRMVEIIRRKGFDTALVMASSPAAFMAWARHRTSRGAGGLISAIQNGRGSIPRPRCF